ncbi:transcriptional regulator, GntR family protein [marine actinobacterium PHSC20C1]|nr:transcriptional regulator, GntR family protein [marine actinobacterium PHSC20C1]
MSPAYQNIADALRLEIESGRLVGGDRLPGEMDLTRTYNVSRNTIRQALSLLESSNLVRRRQGQGTFVAEQGVSHVLGDLRSFTDTLRALGKDPGIAAITVSLDDKPPTAAKDFLPGTHIWAVERIRTADGRPFCRMQSWIPDAIAAHVTTQELELSQSLYAVIADNLDIHPAEATEMIRAEPATSDDARMLEVEVGTPLLSTYRWTSDRHGKPIEYVRSASPGDRYEYVIKLKQ